MTPPLTPPGAQYAETVGNRQEKNRPRYADSATRGNREKQMVADCGSEGRGVEPRRSLSCIPYVKVRLYGQRDLDAQCACTTRDAGKMVLTLAKPSWLVP